MQIASSKPDIGDRPRFPVRPIMDPSSDVADLEDRGNLCLSPILGFTLVELLVTITIAGILLTLAIPSFSNLMAATRAKTTASDFYIAIAKARSEAIKRNQSITITLTASSPDCGGEGTYRMRIEDPVNAVYCSRKGVAITGPGHDVVYQSSGRLAPGTGTVTYRITADAPTPTCRTVTIDPSGRPFVQAATCS
jgi:type IV fimbrial biogenesis protein FimT